MSRGRPVVILMLCCTLLFPVSTGQAANEKEMGFGFFTDRSLVSVQTLVLCPKLNGRVNEIGRRVALVSDNPDLEYAFRIVNDPTINAYSVAGGYVYVTTGLLDVLQSEDELAAVMAHEIAHVCGHDQINFLYAAHRRKIVAEFIGILVAGTIAGAAGVAVPQSSQSAELGRLVDELSRFAGDLVAQGAYVSMVQGYGKKQELKADALAVQYTARAGYDPEALIDVFKTLITVRNKLSSEGKSYASSLVNAEPGLEERIERIRDLSEQDEH